MLRFRHLLSVLLLGGVLLAPAGVAGQDTPAPRADLVERIVAVVGDSVVTLTELQEYLAVLEAQGEKLPTDPTAVARIQEQALDRLVEQLLVLQAAARDTLVVPDDEEIDSRAETMLTQTAERLGGPGPFQQALIQQGMTQAEYREQLRHRIRVDQIQELFFRSQMRTAGQVVVPEEEMRAMFEAQGASATHPELVYLRQAVVTPSPSDSVWAATKSQADSLVTRLRAGEDFVELAKKYSADGSAEGGGDLGWFRRGSMVKEFEEVAFRSPVGQVSEPVRTQFGWHIIKVDRTRPGEVNARHILLRPESGQAADDRALATATDIATRVRAGETMASLVTQYKAQLDVEVPDSLGPIPREQMAQALPLEWQQPLAGSKKGDVVGPFSYPLRGATTWVIIHVVEVKPAGQYTFEELRPQIEAQIREQRLIERIVDGLRAKTFIKKML